LKLSHPYIVDTSILYHHPRGPPLKSSLKWLASKFINREIQKGHGTMGHDSIEDARACLDLVKLKCERGPKWGTSDAAGESIFKRLGRTPKAVNATFNNKTSGKTGAIIDHGAPERNFGTMANHCIGCTSDLDVVEGVKRAVLGDPDGSLIPGGGVDFTWARLRELETLRGWSNDNRHPPSISIPMTFSSDPPPTKSDPSPATLGAAVSQTIQHIQTIRDFLPPCTIFVVYSGTGDPREMGRLQGMQRTFKREYATKKWDELSVKWTDTEEQALRAACMVARQGVGFVSMV
jgi:RNA exonuclease 1